ncbi:MAG: exodeoxyribonuclease III [Spirochaetales bacterium]|nr:exodeoxyribonuclease III [Spirochaetales bacterium]
MKLFSWNVNGVRSCATKGLFDWLEASQADLVCLQETKAQPEQLGPEFTQRPGWQVWWASAQKKGYSGVAIYSRHEPLKVSSLGVEEFDNEGRFLALDFGSWIFAGAYFPNSQEAGARLDYKLGFCQAVAEWGRQRLAQGQQIVLCGDYNIAHQPIDLARPQDNEGNPGYLPEERAWMDGFLADGWTDTFRALHPDTQAFSWWSYRFNARAKNIGWRIDYHCVTQGLKSKLRSAEIFPQVEGSDHVPVFVELELS